MTVVFLREVATAVVMTIAAITAVQAQVRSSEDVLRDLIRRDKRTLANVEKQLKGKALPHIGTHMNEFGLQETECASLALLLGKKSGLSRAPDGNDFPPHPWDTDETMDSVAMSYRMVSNGVIAMETALGASPRDRAMKWNLSCVGQFKNSKTDFVPQPAPRATIDVVQDQLHVFGDIYPGFFEEFKKALDANKGIRTVVLGSGGGSVRDAMLAGKLIRDRRLETTLRADCYSACPLVFLGGVERAIWSPYPRLGFHQVSIDGKSLAADNPVYSLIAGYARSMGADGKFVVSRMQQSPPSEINHPVVWELCEPKVTTWVQRGC